ncbi:MAG: FtsW/RodA/SpoVE family cell cycle protein, partial [Candidatus Omnitrophota bacterium]
MLNILLDKQLNYSPRKIIVICLLFLTIISLACIYSSLHQAGKMEDQDVFRKEIIWVIIAWLVLVIFSLINYRIWFDFAYVLYAVNIVLLVAVYFFGRSALGAQRWLSVGGFNFQPSELSKLITIFVLARFFAHDVNKGFLKGVLLPFGLVMVNVLLIAKQPDLGT